MNSDKPVIEVNNLSKTFFIHHEIKTGLLEYLSHPLSLFKAKGEQFEVLKSIDLKVYPGEFLGIMGRNGSGKSTLLKLIAGIYYPSGGSITINGNLVPFLELGVGFNQDLTARENVFLNGIILGMSKKKLQQKYEEIVAFAELEKFMDTPLKNFSSGMKVRLAFSIAIMTEADIYLLDEVLAVGDIAFQKKCFDVLNSYKNQNKTVILVSHSPSSIKSFCDRAIFLKDGLIQTEESVDAVIEAYQNG